MDPNVTLDEMREAFKDMRRALGAGADMAAFHDAADVAAMCAQDLDAWLTRGGHLPDDWKH